MRRANAADRSRETSVAIVGCGKAKAAESCAAGELYTGGLFRATFDHAKHWHQIVYIVSAKYGLLDPSSTIAPYDETLATKSPAQRAAWARKVAAELADKMRGKVWNVTIYAGADYARPLVAELEQLPHSAHGGRQHLPSPGLTTIAEPMRGLTQGRRLQWLAQQRRYRLTVDPTGTLEGKDFERALRELIPRTKPAPSSSPRRSATPASSAPRARRARRLERTGGQQTMFNPTRYDTLGEWLDAYADLGEHGQWTAQRAYIDKLPIALIQGAGASKHKRWINTRDLADLEKIARAQEPTPAIARILDAIAKARGKPIAPSSSSPPSRPPPSRPRAPATKQQTMFNPTPPPIFRRPATVTQAELRQLAVKAYGEGVTVESERKAGGWWQVGVWSRPVLGEPHRRSLEAHDTARELQHAYQGLANTLRVIADRKAEEGRAVTTEEARELARMHKADGVLRPPGRARQPHEKLERLRYIAHAERLGPHGRQRIWIITPAGLAKLHEYQTQHGPARASDDPRARTARAREAAGQGVLFNPRGRRMKRKTRRNALRPSFWFGEDAEPIEHLDRIPHGPTSYGDLWIVRLPEGSRAPEAPGFYAVIQYDRLPQGGINKVGPPRASDLSGPYDITGGPASHPDDLREDWFTGVPVNEWPDFSDDKSPRYAMSRLGTLRGFGNPRAKKKAAKVPPKARRARAKKPPQDRARARRAPTPRARAPRARRAREPQGPPLELARKTTTHVYTVRKENPAHRSDLYNGRRRVGAGPVVNLRPNPTPLELRPRWIALRTGGKMSERARELTRGQTGVYAIREAAGGPILYIGEAHEAHPTELRRPKRKKGRTRPPAVRRPQPLRWWKTITRHLYPWEWHYDPRDPRSEHNKRPDEWVYRGNHDLEISIWPTTPGEAKTVEGRLILEHRPKHSRKLELPAAEVDELEAAGELEEAPF